VKYLHPFRALALVLQHFTRIYELTWNQFPIKYLLNDLSASMGVRRNFSKSVVGRVYILLIINILLIGLEPPTTTFVVILVYAG